MKKIALAAVLGATVVAPVADAHHRSSHQRGPNGNHCRAIQKAFVLKGTFQSLAQNGDQTTVTLDVTRANRPARRAGYSDPFEATVASNRVRQNGFEDGETPDAGGDPAGDPADKVMVLGKVAFYRRGCDNPTTEDESDRSGAVTIRRVVIVDRDAEATTTP